SVIYPFHQNVLWSFLIALGLIYCNEKAKASGKIRIRIAVGIFTILAGYLLGLITMVDYYHAGILMVLTFYFFHHRNWWDYVGQLLCLGYINLELLGGFGYEVVLFGETVFLTRQGLALLALIPIWLYKGKQGYHSKWWKYFCYAFYPVHLLILGLLKFVL
ncbi:MAG: conjugal transfer protein TraX, partial [Peptococcaceae bacterium]|nr:conjugal transfer protein TraX [Peptococcaceae bacterium]